MVLTSSDSESILLLIVDNLHFMWLFNEDICASILSINCWCSSNKVLFCGKGVLTFEAISGAISFVGEGGGVTSCSSTVNGWRFMMFVPESSWLDWWPQLSLILQNVRCSELLVSVSAIIRKESPYADFLFSNTFCFINSEIIPYIVSLLTLEAPDLLKCS